MDNHEIEQKIYDQGYELIAGVDEVGRGCIAGPVVASAVIIPKGCHIEGVMDSKKLSDKKRRILKEQIEAKAIAYATVFVSEKKIDEINILNASKLAMEKAIQSLSVKPDFVLIDAVKLNLDIPSESIIKGDDLCFAISCASILAKVTRDDFMINLDREFPDYGFAQNKGYPTKKHLNALNNEGILDIHRKSYAPVQRIAAIHLKK